MTHLRLYFIKALGIGLAAAILLGATGPNSTAGTEKAAYTYMQEADEAVSEIIPTSGKIVPVQSRIRALIERFTSDERSLNRYFTFPFSSARNARFTAFYRKWQAILKGIDFSRLQKDGQIDYLLFKNHLASSLRQLELDEKIVLGTASFLPFAQTIISLNEDLKKTKWIEGAQAAKALSEIENRIKEARMLFEGEKAVDQMNIKDALSMLGTLRRGLGEWFDFYNGYDPEFTWWAAESYKIVEQKLHSYEDFLNTKLVESFKPSQKHIFRDPVGRKALAEEAVFEMLPYTPEELLAIGWQELEWCEKERLAATRELGYGDIWPKAIEHVKQLSVEPGEQPKLIRFLTFEAIEFLEKNESLSIPPLVKELIRIVMMSPERQRYTPFFTGGEVISVAYPTNTMPYEQKVASIRGNNPHFSRAVVHHELVPGHNLQMFMSARHKSYRRPFSTRFFTEGWPLYWEMRLWDMEFQRSPEDRIGMLFWRMHRCARIIFSLSFHLGKMTGMECIDFLVDRIGHERDNATVEVTRDLGAHSNPLNQCSYLIGGLQMRTLSKELIDKGGVKAKDFHDAALREGSIPIELLRAKMIDQELRPDFASNWKFYQFSTKK